MNIERTSVAGIPSLDSRIRGDRIRDSRSAAQRQRSEWLGRWAEIAAATWLIAKGYRILARRLRSPFGEIDLVAVRGNRLALSRFFPGFARGICAI